MKLDNQLRFLSLDLLYANPPSADVMLFLLDNGMTREEYAWFMKGEPPGYQIMGCDYYGRNEKIIKPNGEVCSAEDVLGWYQIVREYFERYKKPVMHTETNVFDPELAGQWLWKQWANALRLRQAGAPVLGFTWYSLVDQIDWDTQLAQKTGTVNACGLYDLDRKPRPVAKDFRALLEAFGRISIHAARRDADADRRARAAEGGDVTEAPAIVLLHAFGAAGSAFDPLRARLGPHRTVLAPDLPGFGGAPELPLSIRLHLRRLGGGADRRGGAGTRRAVRLVDGWEDRDGGGGAAAAVAGRAPASGALPALA